MEVFIIILLLLLLSLIPLGVVYISWIFLKISKKEREMDIETIGRSYKESRVENRPGNIQVIRDIGGERIGVSKNSRMRENILIPEGLNEGEKQLLRDFYDI